MQKPTFYYGQDRLHAKLALDIARGLVKAEVNTDIRNKVAANKAIVDEIVAEKKTVYGINTGFGSLCTTTISEEDTKTLQSNILQSHSVGVGEPIATETAKLMLILKLQSLCQGHSGIALDTIDRILWMIENDCIPVVPSQGSVGASGDLAPLSHLFLPLLGKGKVVYQGKTQDTAAVYTQLGLNPIALGPKEGLALINGTQFILAHAVLVVERLQQSLNQADLIAALMIEGLQGSVKPFYKELHDLRPYDGNRHVAARIFDWLQGSENNHHHADCDRVQDPYSLRCIPQIHGASRNAWRHLKDLVEIELNAATDNPIIIDKELTISGGSFHGQPLAMALDYACLAASEIGNVSDRRIYLALEGAPGLPKLLMNSTGLNSGFMILQYTSAALSSENKSLCFPASADSIPTSMGQEDHVSMGSISARKTLRVIDNVQKILGIELMCAAQAFEFRRPLKSNPVLEKVWETVREEVSFADTDRIFAPDMEKAIQMVRENRIGARTNELRKATAWENIFEKY
ncbi:MAG: histidine ammonia-lyase [Flavobacteriaceae bacterium]|nr:histidine ammonia-lyase [Flavobacteriaceae bacterium]